MALSPHPSPIFCLPPTRPLSFPPYQDVLEAEVIVMTQCRALRNESEQAATAPFPWALWQRETG